MNEAYTYRGHSIDLDLEEVARRRFQWTYFIDEDYCIQDTTTSASIDAVRAKALALAHRSVDTLDSIKSTCQPAAVVSPSSESCAAAAMANQAVQRIGMRRTGR